MFPASAGMIRGKPGVYAAVGGVPRIRGDDPACGRATAILCVPRIRGDDPAWL